MIHLERFAPVLFLIMWSSGAIFVKMGLDSASVWSFLTLRAIGALLLMSMLYGFLKLEKIKLDAEMLVKVIGVGMLLQVLYQIFYFLSIRYELSPGLVAVVLGLQPLLTVLISGERQSFYKLIVLLIGFIGLGLAVFGARDVSHVTFLGVFFALLCVTSISTGAILQKKLSVSPLTSGIIQNGCASIVFITVSLYTGWHVNWDAKFIISLSWMTVVVSTGATLLLFYIIQKKSASKVSVLFYLVPVLTMIFDFMVFDTKITLTTLAGVALVMASVKLFNGPDGFVKGLRGSRKSKIVKEGRSVQVSEGGDD